MRTARVAVLLHFALTSLVFAATPRITFERLLAAQHPVAGEDIAIAQAIGDEASIETFVEIFVEQVNKSQVLRMRDSRRATGPADTYLDIKAFSCAMTIRQGEGSARDVDNNKIKRRYEFADATCTAQVNVMSNTMRRVSTFHVKGEGTSPRVEKVAVDERRIAYEQAARYAAIAAAERITPRRVRESVTLEANAPAFEEGMSMIDSGRLRDARAIWTDAVRKNPGSAPLRFNLAAVCEALGDRTAAERNYTAARELAPNEARYALELKLFMKRQ